CRRGDGSRDASRNYRAWGQVTGRPAESWHATCNHSGRTRDGNAKGGVAGDWNRAGQAHPGEAKGPNVGGRSAPFFLGRRRMAARGARQGRRRPAGAEQGGSGLPRRVSTLVTPDYVRKRRIRSVGPSLRRLTRGRKHRRSWTATAVAHSVIAGVARRARTRRGRPTGPR